MKKKTRHILMKRFLLLAAIMLLAQGLSAQTEAYKKLSPGLQRLTTKVSPLGSAAWLVQELSTLNSQPLTIDVLVKFVDGADEEALTETYGLTVKARIGRVLVVSMPVENIQALADDPQRLERWQQAMQAQGLQLARDTGGRLRVSGAGQ